MHDHFAGYGKKVYEATIELRKNMKLGFEEYSNPEIENAIDTWIHGKINREKRIPLIFEGDSFHNFFLSSHSRSSHPYIVHPFPRFIICLTFRKQQ